MQFKQRQNNYPNKSIFGASVRTKSREKQLIFKKVVPEFRITSEPYIKKR